MKWLLVVVLTMQSGPPVTVNAGTHDTLQKCALAGAMMSASAGKHFGTLIRVQTACARVSDT